MGKRPQQNKGKKKGGKRSRVQRDYDEAIQLANERQKGLEVLQGKLGALPGSELQVETRHGHRFEARQAGAPAGSGKKVCAERAVLRAFNRDENARGVYISPMDDAADLMYGSWKARFGKELGKELKYKMHDNPTSRPGHDLRYALDGEKL